VRVKTLLRLIKLYGEDRNAFHLLFQVKKKKLTYLEVDALLDLYRRVRDVERQQLEGDIIEAGAALGGSALMITAAKRENRNFRVYDAFEMIPSPSSSDGEDAHERYAIISSGQAEGIGGTTYYGYEENLLQKVKASFAQFGFVRSEHNVELVKGLFEETLVVDDPVALAHLDCDWYESVMTCLQRIAPHLVKGGALVVDDYDAWSGCRSAVDEFFAGRENEFEFVHQSRLHIIRK
jgi:asparagine synthase (glutamine-hydrolysing)